MLYATCSPVLAETRDVVGSLLVKRDDVKLGDAAALLTAAAGLRTDVPDCVGPLQGTVQLWPHPAPMHWPPRLSRSGSFPGPSTVGTVCDPFGRWANGGMAQRHKNPREGPPRAISSARLQSAVR